jgi:hypothetical protein
MRKGNWLQLNRLLPQCIAGPKYLQMVGTAEQYQKYLVELSESMSEKRKPGGGGQGDRGSGFRMAEKRLEQ